MAINIDAFVIQVIVSTIIGAPVIWLAGRALVGERKAKLSDAIWIVVLGNVVGAVAGAMISGLFGAIIQIALWLGLIRHFFDCRWGRAFLIAVLTTSIFIAIGIALAATGLFPIPPILD
ncbi:hypothetical protein AC482_06540 [miscellaneous Crenarchaeota group-15 archaeon DG-45]|uniref:Uncharacterized protein n=1 Tax=miscellaneous Crenarchaeota group-15 archaeon DG-45 TaxID=1685127 RepID=A0A0M0BM40_9ARCH|nr:MAG: hypothetical protein AC482_06540 [miscellaneous Crenarchaeota group-15 archaeon DG-45]